MDSPAINKGWRALMLAALFPACAFADQPTFIGADGVLKILAAAVREKPAKPTPCATADEWLSLFDAQMSLTHRTRDETSRLQIEEILSVLPPPKEWDTLKTKIDARPIAKDGFEARDRIALRLLGDALTGNKADMAKDVAKAKSLKDHNVDLSDFCASESFEKVEDTIPQQPDEVLKSLQDRLKNGAGYNGGPLERSLDIPDLVSLVGEKKAEAFLRQALVSHDIDVKEGKTLILARKLALELITELKSPQWYLVQSVDTTDLYEAFCKQFPKEKLKNEGNGGTADQARMYYMLGLILKNRIKEAAELERQTKVPGSERIPEDGLIALERAGYTASVVAFLHELLSQNPNLPYWDEYIDLSAKTDQVGEMLKFVRASLNVETVDAKTRHALNSRLFKALLAADEVDEAIQVGEKMLDNEQEKWTTEGEGFGDQLQNRSQLSLKIAEIGYLLQRKPLIDKGIATAQAVLSTQKDDGNPNGAPELQLAELLVKLGREDEAEKLLVDSLANAVEQSLKNPNSSSRTQEHLINLVAFYNHISRPVDVMGLVNKAPYWGVADLAKICNEDASVFSPARIEPPLGFLVASALVNTGKPDVARPILDEVLYQNSALDPAYQLLLTLDGTNSIAKLDTLFLRDQFQNRPLIWKAKVLLDEGKLEEAETVVRRAIAIDPSDGESGVGDRMRVYSVLADIREARGDSKEATFYREVVKSIRLSEDADAMYEAGLVSRAVKMYQDALTHFDNAYCIQSRLAVRLSELGKNDEAAEHYRKAYELMPSSFGRVESHCFGCERAFAGVRQQGIAEKVFQELAVKTPKNPQVFYLLGYLREEQEQYGEALKNFRIAVSLDPEYLNAWKHIVSASQHIHVPAADRDSAALNMLRLDPLDRHGSYSGLESVVDLRALWTAVEKSVTYVHVTPETLYPLAASKAFLDKTGSTHTETSFSSRSDEPLTPGRAVAKQNIVSAIGSLFNN